MYVDHKISEENNNRKVRRSEKNNLGNHLIANQSSNNTFNTYNRSENEVG